MNPSHETTSNDGGIPSWLMRLLPFISAVLGGGAIWYTWYRYSELAAQSSAHWYQWVRPAFLGIMGILCLAAVVLFLLRKPSALSVFKGGLTMIPVMLVANLVVFALTVIQKLFRGDAWPYVERLFSDPKNLIIPIIVVALVVLGALSKKNNTK